MEVFFLKAGQLVAALSLLVVIHEFGHYLFARIFGIRVNKFFLFFNPWFYLVKYNPKTRKWSFFKDKTDKKVGIEEAAKNSNVEDVITETSTKEPITVEKATWRDTEYGVGWLPLGGYVQIAGMIDETQDASQLSKEPQSWEFRAKPAWQRLLVMVGGVLFNFILAILIYAGIVFCWGEQTIQYENATAGVEFVDTAKKVGFQDGDIPLYADGQKIYAANRNHRMMMVNADTVTVLRNGEQVNIAIPDNFMTQLNEEEGFFGYRLPVYVATLSSGDPAEKAGLKEGDHLIAVGEVATPSFTQFAPELEKYKNQEVTLTIVRGNDTIQTNVTPNGSGKIGIGLAPITDIYPVENIEYGFFESFPKGWEVGTETLVSYVTSLKALFEPEGAQQLGGFGAIGSIFPESWNWRAFWEITALLSVILAFMNILPIPALDGGHVLFLLYEIITRRKPNEKFLERAQMIGMFLLFALLIYANANDIYRFFFK